MTKEYFDSGLLIPLPPKLQPLYGSSLSYSSAGEEEWNKREGKCNLLS